jgi:hypothetical protein
MHGCAEGLAVGLPALHNQSNNHIVCKYKHVTIDATHHHYIYDSRMCSARNSCKPQSADTACKGMVSDGSC